jgi:hypothetical protein
MLSRKIEKNASYFGTKFMFCEPRIDIGAIWSNMKELCGGFFIDIYWKTLQHII